MCHVVADHLADDIGADNLANDFADREPDGQSDGEPDHIANGAADRLPNGEPSGHANGKPHNSADGGTDVVTAHTRANRGPDLVEPDLDADPMQHRLRGA